MNLVLWGQEVGDPWKALMDHVEEDLYTMRLQLRIQTLDHVEGGLWKVTDQKEVEQRGNPKKRDRQQQGKHPTPRQGRRVAHGEEETLKPTQARGEAEQLPTRRKPMLVADPVEAEMSSLILVHEEVEMWTRKVPGRRGSGQFQIP